MAAGKHRHLLPRPSSALRKLPPLASSLLSCLGRRTHTVELAGKAGNIKVDLGASWIHGLTGNPLVALAGQAGVALAKQPTDYENSVLYLPDGREASDAQWLKWVAACPQTTHMSGRAGRSPGLLQSPEPRITTTSSKACTAAAATPPRNQPAAAGLRPGPCMRPPPRSSPPPARRWEATFSEFEEYVSELQARDDPLGRDPGLGAAARQFIQGKRLTGLDRQAFL